MTLGKKLKVFKVGLVLTLLWTVFSPTLVLAEDRGTSLGDFSSQLASQLNLGVDQAAAMDPATGQALFRYQDDDLHGIASLTKLLSLYVVYDAIKAGQLDFDTKIPVSEGVAELSRLPNLSNVPLDASTDYYTAGDLIDATLIYSANSAIVALAQYVAGDEATFVEKMGDKLESLGITDYKLYTASGLDGKYQTTHGDQYTSQDENQMRGIDLLRMTQHLLEDYPDILKRSAVPVKDFQVNPETTFRMVNFNEFLPGLAHGREDVLGLKTGTEDLAGACILIVSRINDRPVLLLTLGASDNEARYRETNKLLNGLQDNLAWTLLHQEGEVFASRDHVDVYQGRQDQVDLLYQDNSAAFLPQGIDWAQEKVESYSDNWRYTPQGTLQVKAPLDPSQAVNQVTIRLPFLEDVEGQDMALTNAIVPSEEVEGLSPIVRVTRRMSQLIESLVDQVEDWLDTQSAKAN